MTEQRLNTIAAVAAAVVGGVMLALLLIGGIFVDATELHEALGATETELKTDLNGTEGRLKADLNAAEGRLTTAINASTEQTNAQMEELRGYIINHLDRIATATEIPEPHQSSRWAGTLTASLRPASGRGVFLYALNRQRFGVSDTALADPAAVSATTSRRCRATHMSGSRC